MTPRLVFDSRTIDFPHRWSRMSPRLPVRHVRTNLSADGSSQETINVWLEPAFEALWDRSLHLADADLRMQLSNFILWATLGGTFEFMTHSGEAAFSALDDDAEKGESTITVVDAGGGTGFAVGQRCKLISPTQTEYVQVTDITGDVLTLSAPLIRDWPEETVVRSIEYWKAKLAPPFEDVIVDNTPLLWSFTLRFREVLS